MDEVQQGQIARSKIPAWLPYPAAYDWKHGPLWTADEARHRALDFLRSVRDGRDPATEKSKNREGLTLGALADLYLGEGMTG